MTDVAVLHDSGAPSRWPPGTPMARAAWAVLAEREAGGGPGILVGWRDVQRVAIPRQPGGPDAGLPYEMVTVPCFTVYGWRPLRSGLRP